MNYLVSYNHSGNTWVRYCIEYITGRPTHGHQKFSISERNDNFLLIDTSKEPVLIKRHTLEDIEDTDTFILLLRNPSECIKSDQDVNKEFIKYYSLIRGYEMHEGDKMVFYYHDIFSKGTIKKLIKYLNIWRDEDRMNDLLENWEWHKYVSLSLYENETNKEGADLSAIPKILLDHELIENACSKVYF
jgi:viroplasmin and RNaseH domain-containing protein